MATLKKTPGARQGRATAMDALLDQAIDHHAGGFEGLTSRVHGCGLSDAIASWRAGAAAHPLDMDEVRRIFTADEIAGVAAALGLAEDGLVELLTAYIPARFKRTPETPAI